MTSSTTAKAASNGDTTTQKHVPAQREHGINRLRGDCNFNGVTPETEETPVTDVTTGQDQEPTELSAAD
ncbi:MAG: hypothetical protein ACXVGK_10115, partial [Mycobacteriaceae bacterium]